MAFLLTNVGKANLSNLASGLGGAVMKYIGWGTGTTAAAAADTALQTASSESRTTGTITRVTTTVTNDTFRLAGSITSTSDQSISEVGVFDASTSGNMGIHGVFTALPILNTEIINFQIDTIF